jgi:hypothetical protein
MTYVVIAVLLLVLSNPGYTVSLPELSQGVIRDGVRFLANRNLTIRLDSAGQAEEHCGLSPLGDKSRAKEVLMTPPPQRKPLSAVEHVRIIA